MTYYIGQVLPRDRPRGITSADPTTDTSGTPAPNWFALTVFSQKEATVEAMLKAKGIHSCYPTRQKSWIIRGKRHRRNYPIIGGIVYAKFTRQPQWDVMKARRLITGVYCYGDRPIVLNGDIIAAVMGLPTDQDNLEAARRELLRVREGDKAVLLDTALEGFKVDVLSVAEGRVWWETITGIKGSSSIDKMERYPMV